MGQQLLKMSRAKLQNPKKHRSGRRGYYAKRNKYFFPPPPPDTDKVRVFLADERYFFEWRHKLGGCNYVANQITEDDLETFFNEIEEMDSQKKLPNMWDSINVKRAICCVISIIFLMALVVMGATTRHFYLIPIGLVGGVLAGIGDAIYYQIKFSDVLLARNDEIKTKISAWNITIGDRKNLKMDYELNLRWISIKYIGPESDRAVFASPLNIVTAEPYVKPMIPMQEVKPGYPAQGGNQVVIENISVEVSEFASPFDSFGNAVQDPEN